MQEQIVKTFRGINSSDALRRVKMAFGDSAVVIESKQLRNSRGEPSGIEIIASNGVKRASSQVVGSKSHISEQRIRVTGAASPKSNPLLATLAGNGVSKEVCSALLQLAKVANHNISDGKSVTSAIARRIEFGMPERQKRIIAILGPTGVGKTTSIAKLASLDFLKGRSVALITTDLQRIGGLEQLSAFASMLDLPITRAADNKSLQQALNRFRNYDRIYIDTSGAELRNGKGQEELACLLESRLHDVEKLLLLPASGNYPDLRETCKVAAKLNCTSAAVSKLDETLYFGPCFSALWELGLSLEFFGIGANVPEDIELATASRLMKLICRVRH